MVSTVGTRPNHYERLGLQPTASGDEIAQAFAREMSQFRPHTFGALTELSIAYETLRDPERRKAYDASIAPPPEPPALRSTALWRGSGAFFVHASAHPAERRTVDPLHRPARPPEAPASPEPLADPRLAAIAASLRELARPGAYAGSPPSAPEPAPARHPEAEEKPIVRDAPVTGRIEDERTQELEGGQVQWKRPALIAAGLIAGVGIVGAWAGIVAGNEAEPKESGQAVSFAVPPPKALPIATVTSALAPAPSRVEESAQRRARAAVAVRRVRHQEPQHALSAQELDDLPAVEVSHAASEPAQITTEQAAADFSRAKATPAKLPLSNSTIARTIGRIGYSCGKVSSVVEGEGTGVYTVTCTSGHSYRASPVRGRYHFRRLGSR